MCQTRQQSGRYLRRWAMMECSVGDVATRTRSGTAGELGAAAREGGRERGRSLLRGVPGAGLKTSCSSSHESECLVSASCCWKWSVAGAASTARCPTSFGAGAVFASCCSTCWRFVGPWFSCRDSNCCTSSACKSCTRIRVNCVLRAGPKGCQTRRMASEATYEFNCYYLSARGCRRTADWI